MVLLVQSPIGGGKTSLTKLLSEDLGTTAYYEKVEDMPMLQDFYKAGAESRQAKAFPLQVGFLTYRFGQLGSAIKEENSVLDSSLISDGVMAKNLFNRGEFDEAEFRLYTQLSSYMTNLITAAPTNAKPGLIIYLKIPFELMLEHIKNRGRDMEVIDDDKKAYYYDVWKSYEAWATSYAESPMITIDMEHIDFVNRPQDRILVLDKIEKEMNALSLLTSDELRTIKKRRK